MLPISYFDKPTNFSAFILYSMLNYNYYRRYLGYYCYPAQKFFFFFKFLQFSSYYFKTNIFFFKPKIRKLNWKLPISLRYKNLTFFKKLNSSALLRKFFLQLKKKRYKFLKKNRQVFNFIELKKKFSIKKVNELKILMLHNRFFKKTNQAAFLLSQRVFLTEKQLKNSLWFYLHRISKASIFTSRKKTQHWLENESEREEKQNNVKLKKKIYYLNLHRPILKKLRNARYCHWNFRTYGRLNEYRYHKLIAFELNQTAFLAKYSLVSFLIFSRFLVAFSWKQILNILFYELILINGKPANYCYKLCFGDLIELPSKLGLKRFITKKKRRDYILLARANRLAYKAYLRNSKQNKNIRKHDKTPRLFKRLQLPRFNLSQSFIVDVATNTFLVKDLSILNNVNIENTLINKSVLSLQNWRYRFD